MITGQMQRMIDDKEALRVALETLIQWADKEMGGPCGVQEIEQARLALETTK